MLPKLEAIAGFFLAAFLSAPAWATTATANSALPGTLNYVEGKVSIGTQALDSKSVGSTELQPGQSLTTGKGKAELLLTPGVFLRVGTNSSVQMISPSLTDTEVGLDKGHAMIEVAEIYRENYIRISEQGVTTQLLKTGLYDFDLNSEQIRVFDGKAVVEDGGKHVTVKGGREVSLGGNGSLKPQKFKKKVYEEGDLYRWSSLRSAYLAEANIDAAGIYAAKGWGPWGPGWWGASWYWDPWFDAYTFIPGNGIFYSPFGWGFYSPWRVWQAPFYGSRYGHGNYYHHFSADYHNWGPGAHYVASRNYANGVYHRSGFNGGGFHSSGSGMTASRPGGAYNVGSLRGGAGFNGIGGGFHGHR
jgi:hypothetical protein